MKYTILSLLVFIGCIEFKSINEDFHLRDICKFIKGEWEYKESTDGRLQQSVINSEFPPVFKFVFEDYVDTIGLKIQNDVVKELRRDNVFKDIINKSYTKDGELIDLYFPVGRYINDSTTISVINYGIKRKEEFFIKEIGNDTLILMSNRIYNFGGKMTSEIEHIYLKKTLKKK